MSASAGGRGTHGADVLGFVSASKVARLISRNTKVVKRMADKGLIRRQAIPESRVLYSADDAVRLAREAG